MLVENAFEVVGSLLDELVPLGLEELKALDFDLCRVFGFESVGNGKSFLKLKVVDFASYGYDCRHFKSN